IPGLHAGGGTAQEPCEPPGAAAPAAGWIVRQAIAAGKEQRLNIHEWIIGGGGLLAVLLTLVQIAPVKINPWSAIAKAIGNAINADVLRELDTVTQKLDTHIRVDDERNADSYPTRILQFNNELLREIQHTREDF